MNIKTINIANDFSLFPAGRVISDGPYSGEKFRRDHLIPALEQYEKLVVTLDGVKGYPSSFTEEAFGGLVRDGYDKQDLLNRIQILYTDLAYASYSSEILEAIKSA